MPHGRYLLRSLKENKELQVYTIIGGVNGAGKSSLAGSLRAEHTDLGIVVDPNQLIAQCGGHDIPARDVQARFAHRFADAAKILHYCDEAKLFDNDNVFALAAESHNSQMLQLGSKCPAGLNQMMQEIQ